MNLYQKLVQREKGARKKINNGRFYARDVKVVDDSQLSVNGHLELVPAFLYSLYLTLYKTDTYVKEMGINASPVTRRPVFILDAFNV